MLLVLKRAPNTNQLATTNPLVVRVYRAATMLLGYSTQQNSEFQKRTLRQVHHIPPLKLERIDLHRPTSHSFNLQTSSELPGGVNEPVEGSPEVDVGSTVHMDRLSSLQLSHDGPSVSWVNLKTYDDFDVS